GNDLDAEYALSRLLQRGTVAQYHNEFEILISRVTGKSESLLASIYIFGLKPTLIHALLWSNPTTLKEAFSLSRIVEARYEDERATTAIAKPNDLNIVRVENATKENRCNALLLKVNQIGTDTGSESIEAVRMSKHDGWGVSASHKSSEDELGVAAVYAGVMFWACVASQHTFEVVPHPDTTSNRVVSNVRANAVGQLWKDGFFPGDLCRVEGIMVVNAEWLFPMIDPDEHDPIYYIYDFKDKLVRRLDTIKC
ncbi:reverse transcriptase, partial [Tanacetum coccineum]